MSSRLRLMAVLATPTTNRWAWAVTLAKYASDRVDVFLVTATRGEGGRFRGHPCGDERHPGAAALAGIREAELMAAATALGIRDVSPFD